MLAKNNGARFAIAIAIAIVAIVAIVAAGLSGERWHGHGHGHSAPPALTSAGVPKPSVAAAWQTQWPPVAPALASPAAPSEGASTIEICGAGRVAVDPKDPFGVFANISKLTDARSAEWLSALIDSDDNRARATGLMLQGKVGTGPLSGQVMTEENRDALVQLAVGAGDPAVYAMAVYGNPVTDGACPQLSLSTWAHMDAANAVPWLLLSQQARVQGDDAAAASAFAQAAKAQKVDSYNYSLLAYADPDQPKDTTPLERWSFEIQVAGVESSLQPPHATAAFKYCSDEAMQDSTVRRQCNAVAELYVNKSTTLIDFAMGNALGKHVGWPAARVDALNQEKFALMEAIWEAGPADKDLWSCRAVARGNAYWQERCVGANSARIGRRLHSRASRRKNSRGSSANAWRNLRRICRRATDTPQVSQEYADHSTG